MHDHPFEVVQKGSLSSKEEGLSTPKRYQKPSHVHRNTSALESANYFQSEYPFFTIIMKASYVTGHRNFVSKLTFSMIKFQASLMHFTKTN